MDKYIRFFAAAALIVSVAAALSSCDDDNEKVKEFTVTFNVDGGSAVDNQTVRDGEKAVKPSPDPTKAGHAFGGWHKEAALTTLWNFATDVVTADMTLYAKWNLNAYTVTFNSDGGSAVEPETVAHGEKATKPADPTKAGHNFGGWFKEATLTTAWNFDADIVTADVTLHAKWDIPPLAITGFSPAMARHGATVTITGTGFSTVAAENIVKFNGIEAEIVTWDLADDTQIRVRVPKDVETTGKITVTVGEETVFSATDFTYVLTGTVSTLATITEPFGITIDASGILYVTSASGYHGIRKVTPEGVVSAFAGSSSAGFADGARAEARFFSPHGIAIDAAGNLYVADRENHRIRMVTPEGVVSTIAGSTQGFADGAGAAAQFREPTGIAIDAAGNLYVADRGNHRIRKVTPEGVVSTIAGSTQGFADGAGAAALFNQPTGIAIDATGNLYVADTRNHRIRKVTPEGVVSTFAGSGSEGWSDGVGAAARFSLPNNIVVDAAGNLYVTDDRDIRMITPDRVVITVAGGAYGETNGVGSAARFRQPRGIVFDAAGNLYVTDGNNYRIRKITFE